MQRFTFQPFAKRAFTLVELMVVVVIIGVLATVVTISVTDYVVKAKQNATRGEIATIKNPGNSRGSSN